MTKKTNLKEDEITRYAVISLLEGMPPDSLLVGLSDDQEKHWENVREFASDLSKWFKAYFEGNVNPSMTPEKTREFRLLQKYYLSFYDAIRDGWNLIIETAQKRGDQLPFSTPGECFLAVLEQLCTTMFEMCLEYREWSFRKAYEEDRVLFEAWKIIRFNESFGKKQSLNKRGFPEGKEGRILQKREQIIKRMKQEGSKQSILLYCLKALDETKDPVLKRTLKLHNEAAHGLLREYHARFHPSKKQKGFAFLDGARLTATPRGGFYQRV